MTSEEIIRIARIAVDLGISRIKLTGGEPLVRIDVAGIVEGIGSLHGLTDLSMTTNGTLLAPLAVKLHANGLKRINISLPTLNAEEYKKLTGGRITDALEGIRVAVKSGYSPVKLNMLVLKGINEDYVSRMIEFAEETHAVLQLIELEPINVSEKYYYQRHKTLDEYEKQLEKEAERVATRRYMHNRRVYYLPRATVEVVRPIENTEFCLNCTRLRVTSDGKLKPCLMRNDNLTDILTPIRNGTTDRELTRLFTRANQERRPYQTGPRILQD